MNTTATQGAIGELLAHFPKQISEALTQYATDVVFLHSRYIFVWRDGNAQMAYCTHCKVEYPIGLGSFYVKHNEETQCLNCQSRVTVKSHGRGRSRLADDAYLVWYEKSLLNPHAIVARGLHVIRDYRGDYRNVQTQYAISAVYLFEQAGRSTKSKVLMLKQDWHKRWVECSSAHSLVETEMKHKAVFCSHDNVKTAVLGTPLQYSTWDKYTRQSFDLVRFFELAAKYPCVEYLTKLGFGRIVEAKLSGYTTYRVLNWRGKSIEKVLRLPKDEIRQLKESSIEVVPLTLHSYHVHRNAGINLTILEAHLVREFSEGHYYNSTIEAAATHGIERELLVRYILKQMQRKSAPRSYSHASLVLQDWRDYMNQCKDLGKDISREHIRFPNDLYKAHQKTTRTVKLKHDKHLNKLIEKRLESLEQYTYSDGTYLIRPARDSLELFDEGKVLNHCVGGYAANYAYGKTDIFLVRRVKYASKPLCTVEIIEGAIRQARVRGNKLPAEDVQAFLDRFVAAKLTKPKRKPASRKRTEVAV